VAEVKYVVVVPYAYRPYFEEFKATLKIPEENCLFIDDTDPVGGIGIMAAHNRGIDFMLERGADWLVVMSAGIRFGEAGGIDFIELLRQCGNLHVVNGAGRWFDEGVGEHRVQAMGYHLTAFRREVFDTIGRWDENFSPYGFDDVDMMLRMKKGFGGALQADTFPVDMEHVSRSHSIQLGGVESPSAPRILYFVEKWGRHPGAYQWDGWANPFNDPANSIKYWPQAKTGGRWND
jgi:hypothetical protein